QRLGSHRVDVRQRVRRRDAAEVVRVIDDRGEEVDRLHDRQVVAQPVDGGIVGGRGVYEQLRIAGGGQARNEGVDGRGGQLAAATGAVRQRGQLHLHRSYDAPQMR